MGNTNSTSPHDIYALIQKEENQEKINQLADEIFEIFDADKSGLMQDFEVVHCLESITSFIIKRSNEFVKEQCEKCHNSQHIDESLVRNIVYDILDKNRDAKITKEELRKNLKHALFTIRPTIEK